MGWGIRPAYVEAKKIKKLNETPLLFSSLLSSPLLFIPPTFTLHSSLSCKQSFSFFYPNIDLFLLSNPTDQ
ncbi:hypothetical protein L6452_02065 [Arctium lappa]|uniref:Uncharacterized protein n=1 Tax=Arctium lappa TaxID=4217 RepID=A0ACB9FIL5_ARCLA|nr:hypothetical protein L6452_02065 [Arctium lappa]